jgi:hypothetical protein
MVMKGDHLFCRAVDVREQRRAYCRSAPSSYWCSGLRVPVVRATATAGPWFKLLGCDICTCCPLANSLHPDTLFGCKCSMCAASGAVQAPQPSTRQPVFCCFAALYRPNHGQVHACRLPHDGLQQARGGRVARQRGRRTAPSSTTTSARRGASAPRWACARPETTGRACLRRRSRGWQIARSRATRPRRAAPCRQRRGAASTATARARRCAAAASVTACLQCCLQFLVLLSEGQ